METKGAAFMVLKKESSRARREGSAGRGKRGPVGRAAEKGPGQSRGVAMVDVDPWGAFFEKFWEQPAEGVSTGRHDDGRKPAKGTRMPGTKPGR